MGDQDNEHRKYIPDNEVSVTRVRALEDQVEKLVKAAVGQSASLAMMATLLAKQGTLSAMDARLVVMAGVDAQDYEDLAVGDVTKWAVAQIEEYLKKP